EGADDAGRAVRACDDQLVDAVDSAVGRRPRQVHGDNAEVLAFLQSSDTGIRAGDVLRITAGRRVGHRDAKNTGGVPAGTLEAQVGLDMEVLVELVGPSVEN